MTFSPRTRISPSWRDFISTPAIALPTDPRLRAERMIQRDDRRGLGEAVSLHDGESQLAPELLELGVERRRADDEGPELRAEQPVHVPVLPPAPGNARAGARRTVTLQSERPQRAGVPRARRGAQRVLAQHVENLRHRHQHRDASSS